MSNNFIFALYFLPKSLILFIINFRLYLNSFQGSKTISNKSFKRVKHFIHLIFYKKCNDFLYRSNFIERIWNNIKMIILFVGYIK